MTPVLLLATIISVSTDTDTFQSDLADSLFHQGLHSAAVTEYKRVLFAAEPGNTVLLQLKLGLSLGAAGEIERAAEVLQRAAEVSPDVSHETGLALAGLFVRNMELDRARLELFDLMVFTSDSARQAELHSGLAWIDLKQHLFSQAADNYRKAGQPDVALELDALDRVPGRNPTLAVVLSSFVPGSGEVYAGRPGTGLLSLAVTGMSAVGVYYAARNDDWITASVVLSVFFLRFYNGSRRNASDFAEEFNQVQRSKRLDRLLAEKKLEPAWFQGIQELTGLTLAPSPDCPSPGRESLRVHSPVHHE